jgi:hypothetical protein
MLEQLKYGTMKDRQGWMGWAVATGTGGNRMGTDDASDNDDKYSRSGSGKERAKRGKRQHVQMGYRKTP